MKEIERKFLVVGDDWRNTPHSYRVRQGFLSIDAERTVRVRVVADKGYLTVKGKTLGATRLEYEYEIPASDADELLEQLCKRPLIDKTRFLVDHEGSTWEVDEFYGDNEGLIVAEIELESEDQPFARPVWLGEELTGDPRYYNANLVANPYKRWASVTPHVDER